MDNNLQDSSQEAKRQKPLWPSLAAGSFKAPFSYLDHLQMAGKVRSHNSSCFPSVMTTQSPVQEEELVYLWLGCCT